MNNKIKTHSNHQKLMRIIIAIIIKFLMKIINNKIHKQILIILIQKNNLSSNKKYKIIFCCRKYLNCLLNTLRQSKLSINNYFDL